MNKYSCLKKYPVSVDMLLLSDKQIREEAQELDYSKEWAEKVISFKKEVFIISPNYDKVKKFVIPKGYKYGINWYLEGEDDPYILFFNNRNLLDYLDC